MKNSPTSTEPPNTMPTSECCLSSRSSLAKADPGQHKDVVLRVCFNSARPVRPACGIMDATASAMSMGRLTMSATVSTKAVDERHSLSEGQPRQIRTNRNGKKDRTTRKRKEQLRNQNGRQNQFWLALKSLALQSRGMPIHWFIDSPAH